MSDFFLAAVFLALFYLLVNPARVKVRMNLMVAWFIFIGAIAISLLGAINTGFRTWIGAIQMVAIAVSLFFMLISVDPGVTAGSYSTTNTTPPATPPTV